MDSSRSSESSIDLVKSALAYFQANNDVTTLVENSLNDLFIASPHDIYGYLSEYYEKYEKPAIFSKFEISNLIIYDSKCQPSLRLNVYCIKKNKENKVLSIDLPCYSPSNLVHDSSRIEAIKDDDTSRQNELEKIEELVNNQLSGVIKFYNPQNQGELDAKLSELFKTNQKNFQAQLDEQQKLSTENTETSIKLSQNDSKKLKNPSSAKLKSSKAKSVMSFNGDELAGSNAVKQFHGSHILSSLSKAICLTSSILSKKQPFMHIQHLSEMNLNENKLFSIPKPLVTVLQNGKGFNGKQTLIKEFILFPKPNVSMKETFDLMSKIQRSIRDTLYQSKQMPGSINKCLTDIGCLQCTLDTPQNGIDMIESAIQTICGEDHLSKFNIGLNINAQELFDQEKNKYEVAVGSLKSSDEIIEILADLIAKNPRITMIIDPFIKKDLISWYKLYSKIGKQCLIANIIEAYEISSILNKEHSIDNEEKPIFMPLNLFKYENCITLSEISEKFNKTNNDGLYCGLSCSANETNDAFIVDLAVGNNAKFIKIGGMNRSERIEKINRLLEIEDYLLENNLLDQSSSVNQDVSQLLESINIVTPTQLVSQQLEESTKHKKAK